MVIMISHHHGTCFYWSACECQHWNWLISYKLAFLPCHIKGLGLFVALVSLFGLERSGMGGWTLFVALMVVRKFVVRSNKINCFIIISVNRLIIKYNESLLNRTFNSFH